MSGDSRSVATDALETLGSVLGDGVARDAIHLAVEPAIAGQFLRAGDHIGLRDGAAYTADVKFLGVVDPFLKVTLSKGDKFWLVVYPRQITSLRHVWAHPDFPDSQEVVGMKSEGNVSEKWMRNYADSLGLHFNRLMEGADDWVRSKEHGSWGEYLVDGGTLEGESTSPEFWTHYEILRGTRVPEDAKENFFSCSC